MPASQYVTLNTGAKMPTLGLGTCWFRPTRHAQCSRGIFTGTWKSAPGAVEKAVEVALKNGYRHIDTAQAYGTSPAPLHALPTLIVTSLCTANEREVGEGIKRSGVPREDIFLTTKLNNTEHADPLAGLEKSLAALETPYLDLWLMHWPAPMKDGKADKEHDWRDTWRAMEKVFKEHPEKVKAIGVSNFSVSYLQELLKFATVVPAANQIEAHP